MGLAVEAQSQESDILAEVSNENPSPVGPVEFLDEEEAEEGVTLKRRKLKKNRWFGKKANGKENVPREASTSAG